MLCQICTRSLYRAIKKTLETSQFFSERVKIDGKCIDTLDINESLWLVDNLKLTGWTEWFQKRGNTFKQNLCAHVTKVSGTPTPTQETESFSVESKASKLKKSLEEANITGNIRVDESTGKASLIDVIKIICPTMNDKYASLALSRIIKHQSSNNGDCLAHHITWLQINGMGHMTPVANLSTIVEVIWMLPGKKAKEFCRKSSERPEKKQRLENEEFIEKKMALELAELDHKKAIIDLKYEKDRFAIQADKGRLEYEFLQDTIKVQETLRPLDDLEKIEFSDKVADIKGRVFRSMATSTTSNSTEHDPLVVDPGVSVPTPDCPANIRGDEVSIAQVSGELKIQLGFRAGSVGKRLKALYSERYGQNAAENLPKRLVRFQGKPVKEYMYWSRDRDLIEQAIREVSSK